MSAEEKSLVVRSAVVLPWVVKGLLFWATLGSWLGGAPWGIPALTGSLLVCMLLVNRTFVSWTTVDGPRSEVRQRSWTLFGPRVVVVPREEITGIEVESSHWGSGPQKQERQSLRIVCAGGAVEVHHANADVAQVALHEARIRALLGLPSQ